MKKQISLCLALALALSLVACGGSGTASGGGTAADAAADTAAAGADTADAEGETQAEEVEAAPTGPVYGATIEEQVVLDDAENGIKLTATGMRVGTANERASRSYRSEDEISSMVTIVEQEYLYLDFTAENTSDKSYSVSLVDITVDGCAGFGFAALENEVDGYMQQVVIPAGETIQTCARLSCGSLADFDIETISDIVFTVYLYDAESRETLFTSEPYTLTTSAYGEYAHTFTPEGDVLYDEGGITVILCPCSFTGRAFHNMEEMENFAYCVPLYVSNQTEDWIYLRDAYVEPNGKEYPCYLKSFFCELAPGTCGFSEPYVEFASDNTQSFIDGNTDTYELSFAMEIGSNLPEPFATLSDITVTFDDSESEAYWAGLPTSKEEAEARYNAGN